MGPFSEHQVCEILSDLLAHGVLEAAAFRGKEHTEEAQALCWAYLLAGRGGHTFLPEAVQKKGRGLSRTADYRGLQMSTAPYFRGIIRYLQTAESFDRIQVACTLQVPFGSVSRVFAHLHDRVEAIEPTGGVNVYSAAALRRNPEFVGLRINYGNNNDKTSEVFRKTPQWSRFMTAWHVFLDAGPVL